MTNIVTLPPAMDAKLAQLIEPAPITFSAHDDLSVWSFADGDVVIRLGPASDIGADTIEIPAHHLGALWRTLRSVEEGLG